MTSTRSMLASFGFLLVALMLGAALAVDLETGFVLWAAALGLLALTAPAPVWAGAAVIAALTFKGLATLGVLPEVAIYMDIPLAWGALVAALMRARPDVDRPRLLLVGLGCLVASVFASYVVHPSEALRPLLYLLLLGQPFALIAALLLDPPTPRMRRVLVGVLATLAAIQLPAVMIQAAKFGTQVVPNQPDPLQGTLYGSGTGSHTFSAVVIVGLLWWLSSGGRTILLKFAMSLPYLALPLIADAKQVLFAMPAVVFAGGGKKSPMTYLIRVGVVGAMMYFVIVAPSSDATFKFLGQAREGRGGKTFTAQVVIKEISKDPASFVFGLGPAETVSRAAFMTTYLFSSTDSPLQQLGLHQAQFAIDVDKAARASSGGGSSFNSATSSMIGVLGDLGVAGFASYGALLFGVFRGLRRHPSAQATAALGGWAMLVVLGFVYDWWEQPPFTVYLAVLTGIAMTMPEKLKPGREKGRRPTGGPQGDARGTAPAPVYVDAPSS